MTRQYEQYLQEGFSEKWWQEEYDAPMGIFKRPEWGLWVTSFVAFDLHSPTSFEFLDAWWRENGVLSTQDQVSFRFVAWKMKLYPFSLPSPGVSTGSWMRNDFFARAEHGMWLNYGGYGLENGSRGRVESEARERLKARPEIG